MMIKTEIQKWTTSSWAINYLGVVIGDDDDDDIAGSDDDIAGSDDDSAVYDDDVAGYDDDSETVWWRRRAHQPIELKVAQNPERQLPKIPTLISWYLNRYVTPKEQ